MKKSVLSILLIVILCAGFGRPAIATQRIPSAKGFADDEIYYTETSEEHIATLGNSIGYADNELIVFFKDGATDAQKQSVFDALDAKVIGHTGILNKYQLQLPERKSFAGLLALCAKTKLHKKVALAGCNMALQLKEDVVPDDPWIDPDSGDLEAKTWNEKSISGGNWWLKAPQLPSAWEYKEYFQPIRVGIIDSGFEVDHEDLTGKISFPSKLHKSMNHPESHGTHVAGIISANANNQIGITGICDNAELLCVDWEPDKKFNQKWSTDERIFTGFISLVCGGAKVINLSLGASSGFEEEDAWKWKIGMFFEGFIFSYTMSLLLRSGHDFIMVQSAGNGNHDGDPCDSYYNGSFCSITKKNALTCIGVKKQDVLDRIIIVGSSTSAHDKDVFYQSSFSNYGDGVSIFAPGSWVYSTVLNSEGKYGYKSGTSMAAPNVTGITALTWSVNPKLTGAEVKKIVCDPENTIYTVTNYYNEEIEIPDYPMINAKLSVEAALKTLGLPQEPEESSSEPAEDFSIPFQPPHTIPHTFVHSADEPAFLTDRSDKKTIEKFRGEIGE